MCSEYFTIISRQGYDCRLCRLEGHKSPISLHNISLLPKRPAFNGEKLRKLRIDNSYTLRSLAEKITSEFLYRITFQSLALVGAGITQPGAYLLIVFAKLFGVEEAFFYEELEAQSSPTKGALGE